MYSHCEANYLDICPYSILYPVHKHTAQRGWYIFITDAEPHPLIPTEGQCWCAGSVWLRCWVPSLSQAGEGRGGDRGLFLNRTAVFGITLLCYTGADHSHRCLPVPPASLPGKGLQGTTTWTPAQTFVPLSFKASQDPFSSPPLHSSPLSQPREAPLPPGTTLGLTAVLVSTCVLVCTFGSMFSMSVLFFECVCVCVCVFVCVCVCV